MSSTNPVFPRLLPGSPGWDEAHAAGLRDFLSSPLGQLFLRNLMYLRPEVTARESEQRSIQSDERAGFEQCIGQMMALANPDHT